MLLLLVLVFTQIGSSVQALSCAKPRPPHEELSVSDAVFKGKVIRQDDSRTIFEVQGVWRGSLSKEVELEKDMWLNFTTGKTYVVFANKEGNKYRPRLCGNTGLFTQVDKSELGTMKVFEDSGSEGISPTLLLFVYIIGGIVILGIIIQLTSKLSKKE